MVIDRFDRTIGRGIERVIRGHHRRRLRRVGWEQAIEPPRNGIFCAGEPPPRQGCAIEVLIDGENALPAIAEAIRSARSHVHIAGWHVTPDFELERGEGAQPLRELLAEVAERVPVRVLLWAGAPLPVFNPPRKRVREVRRQLCEGTEIRCELDEREHPVHCHHEKIVVVDDEVAFVGGIDLTELSGDRFDHCHHPPRRKLGWHDIASRLRGPIVADVADHFAFRWREVTGEALPEPAEPAAAGEQTVQLVRTVPQGIYDWLPKGDYRILEAYIRALRSAEHLVYIENQFLWSPEVIEVLADKIRNPPSEDFRVLALLPVHPNNGADVTRGMAAELAAVDDGGGRFLACSIYARGESGEPAPVYVHAKVAIVDDRCLTLGSANLNERSLFNDSEANVVTDDATLARDTRETLWAEHLELPVTEVRAQRHDSLIDERWRPIAAEQLRRRERGEALTHRLVGLPHVSRRSRRLLGPLESFAVDG
jgi:phosphatidylserine/phosphatidylglycerophosphate/cardiolipin synthase-like enzyme